MVMTARHLAKRAPSLKYSSSRPRRPSSPSVTFSPGQSARSWMPLSTLIPGMMPLPARNSGNGSLPARVLCLSVSSNRITPLTNSSMPLVLKSRSRYARRFASVLSTPTDLKRFSQVPLDSSAASSPLPLVSIAAAVLDSRFRSMEHFLLPNGKAEGRNFTLPGACSAGDSNENLADGLVPHAAGHEHFVRIPPPPVARRQDLDLVKAAIPGLFHPRAHERKVDDAVAHHSAVGEQVRGGHQPVADMERQQALVARALDLSLQQGIPPDVVDVHHDTEGTACTAVQFVAQVERLGERVHAGPVGAVHRMQRLDRERDARRTRVIEHSADPVPHYRSRAREVLRARKESADHEHQAPCLEGRGIVDRAQVVVYRGLARPAVRAREHPSAAQPGHGEAVVANRSGRFLRAHLGELIAPGRYAPDAVAGAALDHAAQVPLFPQRGGIERKQLRVGRTAHTLSTPSAWERRPSAASAKISGR